MITLTLWRHLSDDEGTLGLLVSPSATVCRMNELPWRDNRPSLSCIPLGAYPVVYLPRSASGKYRDIYQVMNVPGRSGILIHPGNFAGDTTRGWVADSWGCMLPCQRVGRLGRQRAGLASRAGLAAIHAATGRQDFMLEVKNGMVK